jgi:acyl dehydratase
MTRLRRQAAHGALTKGTTVSVSRTFTDEDLLAFGRITRDYNPVHYEPRWTEGKGYAGPILHGLLVGSMLCEPGGQWGWLATRMSFRFRRPVYAGDTVTCRITITAVEEGGRASAECVFSNQHGEVVLTGEMSGFLPDPDERRLLARMIDEGDPTNELR